MDFKKFRVSWGKTISTMGSSALDSHAKGKKLVDRVEECSMGLDIFFKKTRPSSNCLASRSTSQSFLQSTSRSTSQSTSTAKPKKMTDHC